MKTFLQSNATKVILMYLAWNVLTDLSPMLEQHKIDLWALGKSITGAAILLIGNALRGDINAPGFNWLRGPKDPKP